MSQLSPYMARIMCHLTNGFAATEALLKLIKQLIIVRMISVIFEPHCPIINHMKCVFSKIIVKCVALCGFKCVPLGITGTRLYSETTNRNSSFCKKLL